MIAREPSDIELWERAVGGDPESFGTLFERHARGVYNHCFRRTASWADAEEITSAVFVEAWRRRHEVRPVHESARPWLLGVANNLLRNHRRSHGRYLAAVARLPVPGAQPDPADDVAGRLADERRMREVLDLVDQLPRATRRSWRSAPGPELTYPRPPRCSASRWGPSGPASPEPGPASPSFRGTIRVVGTQMR
jgi:RNA polymerase sigma-70 factor (ECF subfamily)